MSEVRKRVAVLFGGRSGEHEVSKASAAMVMANLREDLYDVLPVYITEDGRWLLYENAVENAATAQWERFGTPAVLSPDTEHKGLLRIVGDKVKRVGVDVVLPMVHGTNGEDGTIQGLCELSGIPYVGCGVLASALCMDKAYTKIVAERLGLRQAKYIVLNSKDILDDVDAATERARAAIGGACFVKPSAAGSSVGISKVKTRKEMAAALTLAAGHGARVIVEKAVNGRELECAVLGGSQPEASGVGEVIPGAEFYDYDAKYNNHDSRTVVTPDLPDGVADEIREAAVALFQAVGGHGMARVDFFLEERYGKPRVVFNEINTIPGFTAISMYPMLWAERGVTGTGLVDRLIQLAFER